VKERIVCEEFDKLIKNIKITIYNTSASSSSIEHKIMICLFEEFITKSEE